MSMISEMADASVDLVKGECFKNFAKMDKESKIKTILKTAMVAIAAGIVAALLGGLVGFAIVFPIVAISAFAYFSSPTVQIQDFVAKGVEYVKANFK